MADKNIGALDQAPQLDDDSLLVVEQQGQAMKVTGAQFKEFGRQAVVTQVQGLVNEAEAAANRAVDAVSAVTDMTVEAHSSDTATVAKTTKNGKVNLNFGLPRGEQGVPGPEGPQGPRGVRGETGKGLTILGYYNTPEALKTAVTAPEAGDAYGVGAEAPYDIYIWDAVAKEWKNNGPLSGGGGVVPENVVTTPGGAELEFSSGDGPHTVSFTFEEEPPLTAEDVVYSDTQTVKEAIDGLFTSVSDGKALIASAITDKGVPTAQDASFADMAGNIGQITTGSDTSDATAAPGDILVGKTAYTAAGKVEGQIPTLGAKTYTPGTAAQVIANGQYLGGNQTIQGDANLTSGNIKKGVSIFGVAGAVEQNFLATLTVTADTGAVVTATHSNGTAVEALSTTGTVTLGLPLEGQWTVTARRGVAQYNSVVINVSSRYSAALTAEVHIVYYGVLTELSVARFLIAAASNSKYAIFAGGALSERTTNEYTASAAVDAYDGLMTRHDVSDLKQRRGRAAAASVGDYVVVAGGFYYKYNSSSGNYEIQYSADVEAFNSTLVKTSAPSLSEGKYYMAAASIGNYVLFGGGRVKSSSSYSETNKVEAYNGDITLSTPNPLSLPSEGYSAASNDNYAVFSGPVSTATAFDSSLTRSTASSSGKTGIAARAGNYVVFARDANTAKTVEAYDLFLTRTKAEDLSEARYYFSGTTINGFAVFAGGKNAGDMGTVDIYDSYLVRTTAQSLGVARSRLVGASIGEYGIFAGGLVGNYQVSTAQKTVEAYHYV